MTSQGVMQHAPSNEECGIREVWACNLDSEFEHIRKVAQTYKYVAMVSCFKDRCWGRLVNESALAFWCWLGSRDFFRTRPTRCRRQAWVTRLQTYGAIYGSRNAIKADQITLLIEPIVTL